MTELPTIQAFMVQAFTEGFVVAAVLYFFGVLTGNWKFWKVGGK